MKSYKELVDDFDLHGIPIEKPDFYDHPNFIVAEQKDGSYLNNYAFFISSRPYSDEYLEKAESIITNASTLLYEHLKKNGRQGACVDITAILARILEKQGVWCASIKGSCTIEFPEYSKEETTYFWSVDTREITAGHSWLFAPPFNIVDITVGEQVYSREKKNFVPNFILEKNGINTTANIEDVISPSAIIELKKQGIPRDCYLESTASYMADVQNYFPVKYINGKSGVRLKYCPVAIHASEEPLEDMKSMDFNGKSPFMLYKRYFEKNICFIKNKQ